MSLLMANSTDMTERSWNKSLRSNTGTPVMGTSIRKRWPQLICIFFFFCLLNHLPKFLISHVTAPASCSPRLRSKKPPDNLPFSDNLLQHPQIFYQRLMKKDKDCKPFPSLPPHHPQVCCWGEKSEGRSLQTPLPTMPPSHL